MNSKHNLSVAETFTPTGKVYRASCACGWKGAPRFRRPEAVDDASAHWTARLCGVCGDEKPLGQSCDCFDNNCS